MEEEEESNKKKEEKEEANASQKDLASSSPKKHELSSSAAAFVPAGKSKSQSVNEKNKDSSSSRPLSSSKGKRATREELTALLTTIKRSLMYGPDKIDSLEKAIKQCRGDLNKDKVLLMYATESPNLSAEVIHHFLDLGSNINDQDEQGRTILNWTIILDVGTFEEDEIIADEGTKMDLIRHLLDYGADVSLTDLDGNDPLKLSLISGQPEFIISLFLEKIRSSPNPGAILNTKNDSGLTALHLMLLSETNSSVSLFQELLQSGADPNITDDVFGNNSLHWLFHSFPYQTSSSEVTQEARNQVHYRYNFQKYPIMFLSAAGIVSCCFQMLMEHKVNINTVNKDGKTPFEVALGSQINPVNFPILTKMIPDQKLIDEMNNRPNEHSILKMVLKKAIRSVLDADFELFIKTLTENNCNMKETGLLCEAIHNFKFKFHAIETLVKYNITITINDIKEAIEMRRLDVAELLLRSIDQDMRQEIKDTFPDILISVLGPTRWGSFDDQLFVKLLDLIKLLIHDYKIDINHINENGSFLHNLIFEYPKETIEILNYVLENCPEIDINMKVPIPNRHLDPWDDGVHCFKSDSNHMIGDDDEVDWQDASQDDDEENKENGNEKEDKSDLKVSKCSLSEQVVEAGASVLRKVQEDENTKKDENVKEFKLEKLLEPKLEEQELDFEEEELYNESGARMIKMEKVDNGKSMMTPLQLALREDRHEIAVILIKNFASTKNLRAPTPSMSGFTECYQLLHQLDVPMKLETPIHSRAVKKEIDWFEEWRDKCRQNVPSLTKLATLAIRRKYSKEEILEIEDQYLLPEAVTKMLHLDDDQDKYLPDEDNSEWVFSSDDDYTDYEDDESDYEFEDADADDFYDQMEAAAAFGHPYLGEEFGLEYYQSDDEDAFDDGDDWLQDQD